MSSTDVNFEPDNKREYEQYLIWRSLPRDMTSETFEGLGITDQQILELSSLRTQKDLSKHIGISEKTICDWNKRPVPDEYKELDWRYWARQATKSVTSAMLRELRKHGDAPRFTAWMKYVEQVEEKHVVQVNHAEAVLEELRQINKATSESTD